MKLFFNNSLLDMQLQRTVGYSLYEGATIGECLSAAAQIQENNLETWYQAWYSLATRIQKIAEQAHVEGHLVSARQAYLRASNYYRTAYFFLRDNLSNPNLLETWKQSVYCFQQAIPILGVSCTFHEISFENSILPAYFFQPDMSNTTRPTIIANGGADGTREEDYFVTVKAALERNYNCFVFEGPGQGQVLFEQKIPMRHDWEQVIKAVINYLSTLAEVDSKRLILSGLSLGGYLAARAAAYEHRLAALMVNPGILDLSQVSLQFLPPRIQQAFLQRDYNAVDQFFTQSMQQNKDTAFFIQSRMVLYGTTSGYDLIAKAQEYTLKDVAHAITCPTLICDNELESLSPGQAIALYNALTCPKTYILFTEAEGAGGHCQPLNSMLWQQRAFDWLDNTLSKVK